VLLVAIAVVFNYCRCQFNIPTYILVVVPH